MKKFLAALLAATLSVTMVACGGGNGGTTGDEGGDKKPPVEDTGYGTLTVSDTYAWLGDYPATEIALNFSKPDKAETVSYEYDQTVISIDETNKTITALKEGSTEVTASSEHFETTFTVTCETVDTNSADKAFSLTEHANGDPKGWDNRVRAFESEWDTKGHNNITTLFIGDSFFDCSYFWSTFYTDYEGKDALCWGIGSTTTYVWETITNRLLVETSPKNIVMHCGTNNVYDLHRSADDITSGLERLFTLMHDRVPSANLYWFNIPQRYPSNIELEKIAEEANARFTAWAEGRKWLTIMDTRSKYDITKTRSDGLHPNADGYKLFMEELAKTNIKMINS